MMTCPGILAKFLHTQPLGTNSTYLLHSQSLCRGRGHHISNVSKISTKFYIQASLRTFHETVGYFLLIFFFLVLFQALKPSILVAVVL
jgi:hypothetical protein